MNELERQILLQITSQLERAWKIVDDELCPQCIGYGYRVYSVSLANSNMIHLTICKDCNGTGKIEVKDDNH